MSKQLATWYRWEQTDLILSLQVQPKASRDEFVGQQGEHYRVRITAPPVEGKANAHLLRWLAGMFAVRKTQVKLESGTQSRFKRVRILAPQQLPIAIPMPKNADAAQCINKT